MDETTELLRLSAVAVASMMTTAPRYEIRLSGACGMALSGEATADLNMILIGHDPNAERFLTQVMELVIARHLPVLAMISPDMAGPLAPKADRLGLTAAGTAPLMVLRQETSVAPSRPCDIRRALGPDAVRIAGDLTSAAFSLDRVIVARAMDVGITDTAGFETYVAWGDAGPMSAVTVTRHGSSAGIWTMATPPQHQGKGMGRALLSGVMDRYRRAGVGRFYLIATEAGRPLYASLGFETVADLSVWVLGHSTQVVA